MGEENLRKITINDSRMNITFKNQDPTNITNETLESALAQNNHLESTKEILQELHELIGLEKVKDLIYEIHALIQVEKMRQELGLNVVNQVYHMLFKGNPGTGKTTVARIVAKLLKNMGILSKGQLIEVERADLVGEYIGHTAQKTRDLVKKAMGGVLFIDEAYSLARGGDKDFGKEAIDCLVKVMEDRNDDLIIILAGYPNEMEMFMEANTGLPSRFPIQLDFQDYTTDELILIAHKMAAERDYIITPETNGKLKELILNEKIIEENFSNARYVRNILEQAIRHQAVRLISRHVKISKQSLMEILPRDLVLPVDDYPKGESIIS
ncbi:MULTISPECIES: AAA family ATPase [Paenibacillus]|uniref:AAA family ATPase n=1 Tax=Paenibacillus odorifer TaxID=189426 RepID=A0A1R0WRM3_9BACL|nr:MULTISPECIES: AAA family ATPase [Paenibacillus]AIQ74819.1 ATPase AAA [Paenibacillus odorifer]ETT46551.1 stage V sporulation protein K [Paenibacillus sp. FSL H8-237]OMD02996.1 AAA family ATPase [Paenibacillus odorifer]OMD03325.1 AAA family ATPase [Paenibacillus odorifer]OMD19855.1 AAA family ATPase [Paenibacillus odorifer]